MSGETERGKRRASISLNDLNRFLVETLEQRGVDDARSVARTVLARLRTQLERGARQRARTAAPRVRRLAPLQPLEAQPSRPAPLEHEKRALLNLLRENSTLTAPFGRSTKPDAEELAALRAAVFELPDGDRSLLLAYHSTSGAQAIAVRRRLAEQLGTSVPELRTRTLAVHRRLIDLLDRADLEIGAAS